MSGFIWLASYPKSGNTWLRLMLACVRNGGAPPDFRTRSGFAPIAADRHGFDEALGIESSDLTEAEIATLRPQVYAAQAAQAEAPLLRKVHDAWTLTPAGVPLFPPDLTLGVVYLVRDPRDIAASLAHHSGLGLEEAIAALGDPHRTLAQGRRRLTEQLPQRLLNWSGHVGSWLDAPWRQPPLLLRYEDMRAAPLAALRRVVEWLGWPADTVLLRRAVDATRFETLQAAERDLGFHERPHGARQFFRRGESGGWRDELSAVQAARIVADHQAVMRRLGYFTNPLRTNG